MTPTDILKQYAKENQTTVRSTSDLGPLEMWLIDRLVKNESPLRISKMATVYKVKMVSHFINYSEKELRQMMEELIKDRERQKGNIIQIEVERE